MCVFLAPAASAVGQAPTQPPRPRICDIEPFPPGGHFYVTTPAPGQPLLELTLSANGSTFVLGEPVRFHLDVRNPATTSAHMARSGSGLGVSIRVTRDATGEVVWDYDHLFAYTADVNACQVPPLAQTMYEAIWDQLDMVHQSTPGPLPVTQPGSYSVIADIGNCRESCVSNALKLTISRKTIGTAEPVAPSTAPSSSRSTSPNAVAIASITALVLLIATGVAAIAARARPRE